MKVDDMVIMDPQDRIIGNERFNASLYCEEEYVCLQKCYPLLNPTDQRMEPHVGCEKCGLLCSRDPSETTRSGPCKGDAGSAVTTLTPSGKYVQVGVNSKSTSDVGQTITCGYMSIDTRVSVFSDWIRRVMDEVGEPFPDIDVI